MVEDFVAIVRRSIFRVRELLCRRFYVGLPWNESVGRVAVVVRMGGDEVCFGFRSFLDHFLPDLF